MKPLIKWAGGKRHIAQLIEGHFPADWKEGTYHEPFLGGGAVFLHVRPRKSRLSDVNPRLISFYKAVKDNWAGLVLEIELLIQEFDSATFEAKRDVYLTMREEFNSDTPGELRKAALLFALNKLCFNGLYRENSKGGFNVPFGQKSTFPQFNPQSVKEVSILLGDSILRNEDFEKALAKATEGDFVYLDPPYIPLDATSSFTSYSSEGFGLDSQVRLARVLGDLQRRGVRALLSNSQTELTRRVYEDFEQIEISAPRMVSAKSSGRGPVAELLIKNY
jgi:DNA adenine methylase